MQVDSLDNSVAHASPRKLSELLSRFLENLRPTGSASGSLAIVAVNNKMFSRMVGALVGDFGRQHFNCFRGFRRPRNTHERALGEAAAAVWASSGFHAIRCGQAWVANEVGALFAEMRVHGIRQTDDALKRVNGIRYVPGDGR